MTTVMTSAANRPAVRKPITQSASAFSARVLCGLLSWADEKAIAPDSLIPGLGERNPDATFSYSAIRLGFARARHLHGGDEIGCVTGSRKTVHHLGPLGPAQMSQATLGEAMRYGLRNQFYAGSLLRMSLVVEAGDAAFECHRLFEDDECGAMMDLDHMVTVINIMSMFHQSPIPVQRIELTGRNTALANDLAVTLGVSVRLGQPVSRLVVHTSLLETPNRRFDEMTRRFWSGVCANEMSLKGQDSAVSLWDLLNAEGDVPSIDQLAIRLNVSARTVHRLLAGEGIDYSRVVDRHRHVRAEAMLRAGKSTESVATALGFSDGRSFRRAFKRWTGLSVSEYRQSHHAGRSDA